MKRLVLCLVAFFTAAAAAPVAAQGGVALAVVGGTPGLGAQLTFGLSPVINLRLGAQGYSLDRTFTERDITYSSTLSLRGALLLLDFHPGGTGGRISLGAAYNHNRVTGTSPTSGVVVINGVTYSIANVGTLEGELKANSIGPYVGIGWGNAVKAGSPLKLVVDVGVYYQGAPSLTLTAHPTNPAIVPPDFYTNVEQERVKAEEDLSKYKFYPVVNLGLSYRF
jgi:hypothetical protein